MLAATPSDGRRPRRCQGWLRCCQRPPRRRSASPTRRLRARHSTPACAATRGRFLTAASLPAPPRPLHPPAEANLPAPPRRHAVADSARRSLARLVDGPAVPTVHSLRTPRSTGGAAAPRDLLLASTGSCASEATVRQATLSSGGHPAGRFGPSGSRALSRGIARPPTLAVGRWPFGAVEPALQESARPALPRPPHAPRSP